MTAAEQVTEAVFELQNACQEFVEGWPDFCKRINWDSSFLDAEAIRFFNVVPSRIEQALRKTKGNT